MYSEVDGAVRREDDCQSSEERGMGSSQHPPSASPARIVPIKTAQGHDEIRQRTRAIGQRLRTVLLLVDGRRSHAELRDLALHVGASEHCLDELQALGLVTLPQLEIAPAAVAHEAPAVEPQEPSDAVEAPVPVDAGPEARLLEDFGDDDGGPHTIRLTANLLEEGEGPGDERDADSGAPTTRSSLVDSMMSTLYPLFESAFGGLGGTDEAGQPRDPVMEEVRRMLMREVRSRAPVTGAMTVMKLRRAASREDVLVLLDEVASHIAQPMRQLSAHQILTNARSMLERPN